MAKGAGSNPRLKRAAYVGQPPTNERDGSMRQASGGQVEQPPSKKGTGATSPRVPAVEQPRLTPLGKRTLDGFVDKYGAQSGETKFRDAVRSGTLSASNMYLAPQGGSFIGMGRNPITKPAAASGNGGLDGPFRRQSGGSTTELAGLQGMSRQGGTGAGAFGGLQSQNRQSPMSTARPGPPAPTERNPGFGGPPGSTSASGGSQTTPQKKKPVTGQTKNAGLRGMARD